MMRVLHSAVAQSWLSLLAAASPPISFECGGVIMTWAREASPAHHLLPRPFHGHRRLLTIACRGAASGRLKRESPDEAAAGRCKGKLQNVRHSHDSCSWLP